MALGPRSGRVAGTSVGAGGKGTRPCGRKPGSSILPSWFVVGYPVPRTTDWSICPPAGQVVDEVWDFPNGYGLRVFARTIGELRRDGFYVSLTPWVDGLGLSRDGWTGTLPKFDREWPTQLPSENLRVWEIVEAVSELPDLPNNWWKKSPWKDWGR